MTIELVYELCGRLAGAGVIVAAVEVLVSRREFQPQGIFDPRVRGDVAVTLRPAWGEAMLSSTTVAAVNILRLAAGLSLLLAPWSLAVQTAAWSTVAASMLYMKWRRQLGDDGGEQMLLIMSVAFAISLMFHSAPGALEAGAYFVGAQACFSYLVAGVAKLMGPDWRRGNVIPLILSTRTFGARRTASLLERHPPLARMLCWGTIAFESSFLFAPLLPLPALIALLAIAASFHLGIAALMGLNGFLWAFIGTYPAIIFLNQGVHSLL
jgi:hypothetical protein